MKRPTQKDVAGLAGVSRATVSYVLNKQRAGRVPISEDTRQRVIEAAEELGYEPDARAQSLRSGSTKTIGMLIPDMQNPHFWQIVDGVAQAAREAGYELLLASSDLDRKQEEDSLKSLLRHRVDGLVLSVTFSKVAQKMLDQMIQRNLPIVMTSYSQSATFDCVGSSYIESTKEVMAHLLSLGHKRIAFIHGVASLKRGQDRLQPYETGLQDAGLPVDGDLLVQCGPSIQEGHEAVKRLLTLPSPPTALIVINDLLAMGALRAAADLELRIPQDLSLVSFDDIPMANYLTPRLTTVNTDAEAIGRGAVELLLKRLKDPERSPQLAHIPAHLTIRESTGEAPVK